MTNTAKHAGRGATTSIVLAWGPREVTLTVTDVRGDRPDGPREPVPGGGYGLTGLRERAELAGGSLEAGPTEDGYAVRLTLPTSTRRAAHDPDQPVRVLVVDDLRVVREGLQMLLGLLDTVEVVGTAADGEEALEQVTADPPDVVLMDLNMRAWTASRRPGGSRSPTRTCRSSSLTTLSDDQQVFAALQAGARGYLTSRDAGAAEIENAILTAARGQALLTPTSSAGCSTRCEPARPSGCPRPAPHRCPALFPTG